MIKRVHLKDTDNFAILTNEYGDQTVRLYDDIEKFDWDKNNCDVIYESTFFERLEGDLFEITTFLKRREISKKKEEVKDFFFFKITNDETNELVGYTYNYEFARELELETNNMRVEDVIIVRSEVKRKYEKVIVLEVYKGKDKQYERGFSNREFNEEKMNEFIKETFEEFNEKKNNFGRNIVTDKGTFKVFVDGKLKETFELGWDATEYARYLRKVLPINSNIEVYSKKNGFYGLGEYRYKGNKFKRLLG